MKKKALALVMALALVLCAFSGYKTSAAALSQDKMKQILLTVKEKLNIGNEYEDFTQDYYEDGSEKTIIYYNWSREDGSESINAAVDNKGRILNYNRYSNNNVGNTVPTYTKNESVPFAEDFINRIAPELGGSFRLVSSYYSGYSQEYTLRFIRVENGIDLADNYVRVNVNSNTGAVTAFSTNWEYDVKLTAAEKLISAEDAKAKLATIISMGLEYRLGWNYETNEYVVFLAYNPNRYYASVNAKNGRLYTNKYYVNEIDYENDNSFTEAAAADDAGADKNAGLSEAELQKLEELKGLISSDEAVAAILNNPYLYSEEGVDYSQSVRLYSNGDGSYEWNITLQDERPFEELEDISEYYNGMYYRSCIYATVDAKTGEILSYYASVRDMYEYPEEELANLKVNYTKKQCKSIFAEFARSANADKFAETKLSDISRSLVIAYDEETNKSTYGGYNFDYVRYHENIPFSANRISGSVEAVTGKVTSYNVYWDEVEFPSSKGALTAEEAFDAYIDVCGLDLAYELVTVYSNNYSRSTVKSRLVYGLTNNFRGYIDAFTGKHIDYSGSEYVENSGDYEYTDIEGSKYERSILLLAGMGIGFEGTEFKPDQTITRGELLKLLQRNYYYPVYTIDSVSDVTEEYDNNDNDNEKLTRDSAAAVAIEALGMQSLAQMDIFKTGYDDEASIRNVGAVAILKGYGIMGAAKGNSFMPAKKFTRGEAAELVIKLLTAKLQ